MFITNFLTKLKNEWGIDYVRHSTYLFLFFNIIFIAILYIEHITGIDLSYISIPVGFFAVILSTYYTMF